MVAIREVVAAQTPYTFTGRGDGHGRGMGQWGAFGYAKQGWSADRILAYYYTGTSFGTIPPTKIRVRLEGLDNKPLVVTSDAGFDVAGRRFAQGEVAHLTPTAQGADVTVTDGCDGTVVWQGSTDNPWVDPINRDPDRPIGEHLKLCGTDTTYRGSLGVALDGKESRAINYVDVEDYLLGVVPSEMSPGWADQGGAEALRAQAIAARSYAIAEKRWDYAQTCDTQSCQVYGGSAKEDPRTTDAVRSTQGKVLMSDGQVFRAEYSASTGGVTDTGKVDAGDAAAPDNSGWTKTVSAGDIAAAFNVGDLQSISVEDRDPAGRVTKLKVVGTTGTVECSGDDARGKLNLDSDLFDVAEGTNATPPPPPAPAPAPAPVPEPAPAPAQPPTPAPTGVDPTVPDQTKVNADVSAIDAKYQSTGGAAGPLGAPLGPEMDLPQGAGKFRTFTGGVIIWTQELGAQVVETSALLNALPQK
ncbi:SpoIID/LytB domain-containing protein [Skermania sp. ID1734]|nr:SpoIID/LytB domain-containing protein [Skermania sp. ID1734]